MSSGLRTEHRTPGEAPGTPTVSFRAAKPYRPSNKTASMPKNAGASRILRVNEYRQKTLGGRVRKFFSGLFGSK